ncbi:lysophospholipid acyltransferase family protein [Mycolicibacterium arenosum]|uniref:Acyltransferase family protein n=1 Tax=Mycolicibacterium arenosum TaxID=2952157 RepID=A0ABT1MGE2_9MYCO|nr:lysophospholipid acyltransferase family protein [Mycolicibacterium sp. CAU 1645]MCP9276822.1 acyltransferase family protein [Mycolicibacterium sp. CAU 1645]
MTESPSAADRDDVEPLADAILDAAERGADTRPDENAPPDAFSTAAMVFRRLSIDFVRRYNRLEVDTDAHAFDGPVLFVANHGFGGIFDLNVFAVGAALDQLELDRPITVLTHQLAWTLGVGRFVEALGARPASQASAEEAFNQGHHVVVFPGGDVDAMKSWEDRNRIIFGGRSGFARLAIENKVPIVPIVTAGAGESLLVLSSGERLARATRLDKLLRLKAAPVTVSLPWGLNVGAVGILPYLPLPTKLKTRVLTAMTATEDEDALEFAARVEIAMQRALTE